MNEQREVLKFKDVFPNITEENKIDPNDISPDFLSVTHIIDEYYLDENWQEIKCVVQRKSDKKFFRVFYIEVPKGSFVNIQKPITQVFRRTKTIKIDDFL